MGNLNKTTAEINAILDGISNNSIDIEQANSQTNILSARFGKELFPCFYRVGAGDIDGINAGDTERYRFYAMFRTLKMYNVREPDRKTRLTLVRRNNSNRWQFIFAQEQDDGSFDRIFYDGINGLTENANGTTRFDVTDSSTGVRVIADVDWRLVPDGVSGSPDNESAGESILVVKTDLMKKYDVGFETKLSYDSWKNENQHVLNTLSGIKAKLLSRSSDIELLVVGDSLSAFFNKTAIANPEHQPCQMICTNWTYYLWKYLNDVDIEADRWDSTNNPFTETGAFTDSYTFFDSTTLPYWTADTMGEGHRTRYSNTSEAAIQFSWDLDSYEKIHFIHRLDYRGSNSVTIAITEGNGKVEVYNGSAWVEANGYNFSQQLTENTQGSGYSNTLSNWRLPLRKASGATGTVTVSFTKAADSDYLFYWGVEKWNGNRIVVSNSSRGGREVTYFQDVIQNDIIGRSPDLLLFQLPLINEYDNELGNTHLSATVENNFQDFIWGDRSGNLNANSLKNLTTDWTDFEVLAVVPHFRYEFFNSDGNTFIKEDVFNAGDYMDETPNVVYNRVKKLFNDKGDVPFIEMASAFKREAFGRELTQKEIYNSYGLTSLQGFTIDTVHQNDLGSLIWAKYIAPSLDVVQ